MIKGTLLVVDDDQDLREVLVDMLTPLVEKVVTAENGKKALAIVNQGGVDAVITDIKMPVMTGLQFLAEVRAVFNQIPVIVLTAFGDKANSIEALRLNATDFLEKPFSTQELEIVVQKALAYGVALREMEAQVDELFAHTTLPADEVQRMKKVKRIVLGMKLGFSTYTKKAA